MAPSNSDSQDAEIDLDHRGDDADALLQVMANKFLTNLINYLKTGPWGPRIIIRIFENNLDHRGDDADAFLQVLEHKLRQLGVATGPHLGQLLAPDLLHHLLRLPLAHLPIAHLRLGTNMKEIKIFSSE